MAQAFRLKLKRSASLRVIRDAISVVEEGQKANRLRAASNTNASAGGGSLLSLRRVNSMSKQEDGKAALRRLSVLHAPEKRREQEKLERQQNVVLAL